MLPTGQDGVPSISSQHNYYPWHLPACSRGILLFAFVPSKYTSSVSCHLSWFLSLVKIPPLVVLSLVYLDFAFTVFWFCHFCFHSMIVCFCWPQTWDLHLHLPGAEPQVYTTHSVFNLPFCWESLLPPAEHPLLCMSDPPSLLFPF